MFSATWPTDIQRLAAEFLSDSVKITIGSQDLSASHSVSQARAVCRDEPHSGLVVDCVCNSRELGARHGHQGFRVRALLSTVVGCSTA